MHLGILFQTWGLYIVKFFRKLEEFLIDVFSYVLIKENHFSYVDNLIGANLLVIFPFWFLGYVELVIQI